MGYLTVDLTYKHYMFFFHWQIHLFLERCVNNSWKQFEIAAGLMFRYVYEYMRDIFNLINYDGFGSGVMYVNSNLLPKIYQLLSTQLNISIKCKHAVAAKFYHFSNILCKRRRRRKKEKSVMPTIKFSLRYT